MRLPNASVYLAAFAGAAPEEDPNGDTASGLGLAIVHTIAEQHRARRTLLDSTLGELRAQVRFAPGA